MCTTHDRIANICDIIRANPKKYADYKIFPCMPYAHKYANAVTELGITGAMKQYVPGNFIGSLFKGGVAFLSKDYLSIMELMIDAEMKMFKGVSTPVIFLQNVVTDLLLGLGATSVLKAFHDYVEKKYDAEAGFITMNMPMLLPRRMHRAERHATTRDAAGAGTETCVALGYCVNWRAATPSCRRCVDARNAWGLRAYPIRKWGRFAPPPSPFGLCYSAVSSSVSPSRRINSRARSASS